MPFNGTEASALVNYAAYIDPDTNQPRIGHYDLEKQMVLPLSYPSGAPLTSLLQVIELGEKQFQGGEARKIPDVKLLPPISDRDILAVGKNYVEHAKEFHSSGYDSSDKTDQPTHPVIFTKRATSIIASGDEIYPHPGFTETVDYEGEIGVIIGKSGFQISETDAMEHVWGYTIINDVTARERQRDHKQFFIGKSPDTFCPMGPIAVPKEHLPKLTLTTHVNGEQRQKASLDDLIFSVPVLVKTLSEGQTLQAGDVLATGTPVGVGFGFRPMVFLKPGDEVRVSVTGLGELVNKIAPLDSVNPTVKSITSQSHAPIANEDRNPGGLSLTCISDKRLFYQRAGEQNGPPVVFIHGLGGSHAYFRQLYSQLSVTHSLHLTDLEGHGLSPTSALSKLSVSSFGNDIFNLLKQSGVSSGVTVVAHSLGCLVALNLAIKHPELVSKLVLMGPPPSPIPDAVSQGSRARAALVRAKGMFAVAEAVIGAGFSDASKAGNPLGVAAAQLSLLGTNPEGYAKACTALADSVSTTLPVEQIKASTFILTGSEDKVSAPVTCQAYAERIGGATLKVLHDIGHWHLFEDPKQTTDAVVNFLVN